MDQLDNTPITPSSSGSGAPGVAGWVSVWIKAVTKPSEQTFIDITEKPRRERKNSPIFGSSSQGPISGIIQLLQPRLRMATGVASQFSQIPGLEKYFLNPVAVGASVLSLIGGLCASPFVGLLSVLFFALFVVLIQWIRQIIRRTGTYEKLL